MLANTTGKRRFGRIRDLILTNAEDMIQEQGWESFSMRKLGSRIDYTAAAIYTYFANKDILIEAVRQKGFERLAAHISSNIREHEDPADLLFDIGQRYLKFAQDFPNIYMLMYSKKDAPGSIQNASNTVGFSSTIKVFQEECAAGRLLLLKGFDPVSQAFHFWLILHAIAMVRITIMSRPESGFKDMSDNIFKQLIENIRV